MKNILGIIRHDLRKITGSVVAMITILGLCIIPCLYAWFNIFSNWAPYESDATGRISVAVANLDKGDSVAGLSINVGDKLIEALEANSDIGWVFADDDESAIEGVYSGDYYAALVIPEDFTSDVLSFTQGDLTNPTIKYYENEKKNAIAPKITNKAQEALQDEINAAFVETLAGYVSDAAAIADANGIDPASLLADISDRIEDLSGDLDSCITLADSAAGLTDAAGSLLDVSDTFIGSTQDVLASNDKLLKEAQEELNKVKKPDTSEIDAAIDKAEEIAGSLETFKTIVVQVMSGELAFDVFLDLNRDDLVTKVNKLKNAADEQGAIVKSEGFTALASEFEELSKTLARISSELSALNTGMSHDERLAALTKISDDHDKAVALTEKILKQIKTDIDEDLETALKNARTSLSDFRSTMSGAQKGLGSLSRTMGSYESAIAGLKKSIEKTSKGLEDLRDGADSVAGLLMNASGNDLLQELSTLMGGDEAAVAEYLANPIKMKTEVIWPIATFGSVMAPFYTVLAQWVGALLTAVLIKVRLRKREGPEKLRLHQWYFGRFGLFMLIGLAQALIVSLGDILYIGIQCVSPVRFVLAAIVNGLVFMMINYALVFALDNIGLAAGVIILVLQVAGSGGTYPVEVLPGIFRTLYPLMPFHYAMDAMRECIGGMYDGTYWRCIGILMLIFLFSIAFGLAFYRPARKLNEVIARSKEGSEIML
ncbi:MAG: YhgE/Pip domain-containing protein [Mogibacterium sp.]|nr:YhgE/Pip domain-containing protein [Mogibacterium sp.]